MTARVRLFAAVRVPDEHQRVVDEAVAPLRARVAGARWTPPESRHVTVKFVGYLDAGLVDDALAAVASCARRQGASDVRLSELGAFPGPRRARVLWAGLDDPDSLLARLAADLDDAFEPLGVEPERRAFTPHLTLARFREPARLDGMLPVLPRAGLPPFRVADVELFRSHLSPRGARYESLARVPLVSCGDGA
ncbi:MAG TPA: RNA 2',3'-cyclic phosphodiesterase [Actinomycetota bacterium]|nr:RNA 2',3'-cyclic phosphodiesterase [Actinomycetota bacterium]